MIKLAPSILSADFVNLERDVHVLEAAGADYVHVDVMDGIFVPNITIGIPVTEALRRVSALPLDVHLMIDRPLRYVERFVRAGADIVTVHVEAETREETLESIRIIHSLGARAGAVIKPKTPASELLPLLPLLDLALVMTVEPGFGGQSFMWDMLPKVTELRRELERLGRPCELEVDGGVSPETAPACIEAGADVLVAGSSVFKAKDKAEMIAVLRGK